MFDKFKYCRRIWEKYHKKLCEFLYLAEGSLREVEAAVTLSIRLGFVKTIDCDKINVLIVEEMKMLSVLIKKLEEKIK